MNDHYSIIANFGEYIPMVAVGTLHTVGLKSDGTAVAVGSCYPAQCALFNWENITQVAAGGRHTMGLKSCGTVVAVGGRSVRLIKMGGMIWQIQSLYL